MIQAEQIIVSTRTIPKTSRNSGGISKMAMAPELGRGVREVFSQACEKEVTEEANYSSCCLNEHVPYKKEGGALG